MKNCKDEILKLETKRKILNFISKVFLILTLVFFILLIVAVVKLTKNTDDIKAFITLAILFGCTCLSILIVVESNAYFSKKVMKTGVVKIKNKSYSMGVLSQSLIKRIEGYSFRYSCVHKLIDALELSKEKYTNQD